VYDGKILREGTSDFLVQDETARQFYLGANFRM
jgi:ABC-type lipopolysaccharide export system ATPase subunit